ncbi:ABC transporter ATP-binding protein [Serinibacter salmoneus]|uniref:ABC-type dipeptide/oligopeptide/nickel transport system ATPase subunit n=1 Tax=Serinibacter salmoneus TaxID=556530 RepID=A0A2A9D1P7_9MICO|nr:ATP-binding cassette domain-containing protein [Serinibacter salmoneus]PFG20594.1 ABC-type dipeptide/oligopeptide/nickel transport system ATPase subunit [Serinibacter salmoneus]
MARDVEVILEARGASFSYDYEEVVSGIDLTLSRPADPVGIVGPSGAGKTTLLHLLLGNRRPTTGTVTYRGHAVARLGRREKKTFAGAVRHVSQYGVPTSDPRLTVLKYLSDALKVARKAGRTHATPIEELLAFVALEEHVIDRRIVTLSGGERQRLALAHALATRPDVMLLDEPLTAIDPGLRAEVLRRLADRAQQMSITMLVVSHDIEAIDRLCPLVHVMADGAFVASGSLRDILADPQHPAVVDLAKAAPLVAQRLR